MGKFALHFFPEGQSTWVNSHYTSVLRASQRGKMRDNINSAILFKMPRILAHDSSQPWSVSKLPSPAPLEERQLDTAGDDV